MKKNKTEQMGPKQVIVRRDVTPGLLSEFKEQLEKLGFEFIKKKAELEIPAEGKKDPNTLHAFTRGVYRDVYEREEGRDMLPGTRIAICYDNMASLQIAEETTGEPDEPHIVHSYEHTRAKYGIPQDLLEFLRLNGFRRSPRDAKQRKSALQPHTGANMVRTTIWFERGGFEDEWMGIKIKVQDVREPADTNE